MISVLIAPAVEAATAVERAYLYQRQARSVLTSHGWRVTLDKNGKLVANHPAGPMGAAGGGSSKIGLIPNALPANGPLHAYAWLTLTFQPDSLSHTKCSANSLLYLFWDGAREKVKPTPFTDPEATKIIQDMMIEAEGGLTKDHPEYAKKR